MAAGIETRHGAACRSGGGGRCNCEPTYRAHIHRDDRRIRRTFPTLAAAKSWREDAAVALRQRTLQGDAPVTVRQAAEAWLEGARDGSIRNRSGDVFKPSSIRGYERSLNKRVLPAFGAKRLSDLRRADVQHFADRMLAERLGPSTIANALDPLRCIYRRALSRDQVAINPTRGIELPANRGQRERIASPVEGRALLAALAEGDRPLWATAMYAGLRRGELRGLRWSDVDLAAGTIRVERSWDVKEGVIEVKTRAGRRTIPIIADLRRELRAHKLRTGRSGDDYVFGTSATTPCEPTNVRRRALTAWKHAGLEPIGLHECRHTFASLMIAARVETKALSTYLGHASVAITFDRYGHLFPGNEAEAAQQLDAYLSRSSGQSSGQ